MWVRWPLQPLQPLQKAQLQPPFGPSVDSLCHPCITTTHLSYSVLSLKLPPPPRAVLLVMARVISEHPATPTDRQIVVCNTGIPPGTTSATSHRCGATHNDQVEMQWRWSCSVKKPTRLLATSEVFALCIQCAADRLQILSFHGVLPLESAKMAVFARRARACRQSEERRSKCAKG